MNLDPPVPLIDAAWSFSGTGRVEVCPASAVLPQTDEPDGEPAVTGRDKHSFLQIYGEQGRDAALATVPADSPWKPFAEGIDLAPILTDARRVWFEMPLAYNPETSHAVRVQVDGPRGYLNVPAGYVPGTLDLVKETLGGELEVWDYKTGAKHVSARCGQMKIAAVAVARLFDIERVRVGILQIDEEGQYHDGNAVVYERDAPEDRCDLDEAAIDLRRTYRAVLRAAQQLAAGIAPGVHVSPECDYCPAMRSCPAVSRLAGALVQAPQGAALTAAEAGAAWHKIKLAERMIEVIKRDLKPWFTQAGALPAPGGGFFVRNEVGKETVDPEIAIPFLRACLSPDEFRSVLTVSITKANLQRTLGKKKADQLLTHLRAKNAVKKSYYETVTHKKEAEK